MQFPPESAATPVATSSLDDPNSLVHSTAPESSNRITNVSHDP
eukprot:CAMPEP_0113722182 /NCGR_PEP_ID=MMETSP0038_2-20120614/37583_1 /TAXON_ID=2898 /ORGANISM="Cryptomonas paramecium" /LENGTH=42 /DNA_ID=CAMNT_0000651347 /DNA_START=514 /DNA_END=638 /DNA_ORIENTATION=- /assembly_acc=CAM_ASM_000170